MRPRLLRAICGAMLLLLTALPVLPIVCAGECVLEATVGASRADDHCHKQASPEGVALRADLTESCKLLTSGIAAARDRSATRAPAIEVAVHTARAPDQHWPGPVLMAPSARRVALTGTPPGHHVPLRI